MEFFRLHLTPRNVEYIYRVVAQKSPKFCCTVLSVDSTYDIHDLVKRKRDSGNPKGNMPSVFDDNTYFKLEKCPIQDRFHLKDFDIDSSSKHESTTDYLSSSDVDYKKGEC